MTSEEIRETLYRTLDKLDRMYGDKTNVETPLRKEWKIYQREMTKLFK